VNDPVLHGLDKAIAELEAIVAASGPVPFAPEPVIFEDGQYDEAKVAAMHAKYPACRLILKTIVESPMRLAARPDTETDAEVDAAVARASERLSRRREAW
jgi:hypothetical protein